jgi:hypothetical protein
MTQLEIAVSWLRRHGHIALCIAVAVAAVFIVRAHTVELPLDAR